MSQLMNRRHMLELGFLSSTSMLLGWKLLAAPANHEQLAAYIRQMEIIRPLFTKKGPPQGGDWLSAHKESGQTFAEYRASDPNRPTKERTKIYLQPIGAGDEARNRVITLLREFMQLIFGLEVVMLPMLSLATIPAAAQRVNGFTNQRQLLSTHILHSILKPNRPADAVAVLAITHEDLWPGKGWNFVFGQASLGERVGVWSTARMGDPAKEPTLFLRRVLQVAVHETGHMFGIKHCTAYECCMNGANHQGESDRAPLVFCAECDAKLWWACQLKPGPRAKDLTTFAEKHQLKSDAAQWRHIAEALG
jgi:archaemetzincin